MRAAANCDVTHFTVWHLRHNFRCREALKEPKCTCLRHDVNVLGQRSLSRIRHHRSCNSHHCERSVLCLDGCAAIVPKQGNEIAASSPDERSGIPYSAREPTRLPRTASGTGKDAIMRSIPSPAFLYPCGVRGGMITLMLVDGASFNPLAKATTLASAG